MLQSGLNPPPRRRIYAGDPVKGARHDNPDLFVGLDLSLTGSGVADLRHGHIQTTLWDKGKKLRGAERLDALEHLLRDKLDVGNDLPLLVGIEGYSYASKNGGERIGEWGGVARLCLHRHQIPYVEISPGQVKKFVLGKGSGAKALVIKELFKRFGVDRDDDNEADAAIIAIITACLVDDTVLQKLTKPQVDVVAELRKSHAAILQRVAPRA